MNFIKRIQSTIDNFIDNNFILVFTWYKTILSFRFINYKLIRLSKNISVINTHDLSGGASKVAFSLVNELSKKFNIRFFVKYSNTNNKHVETIHEVKSSIFIRILRRISHKKGWIEFGGFDILNMVNNHFFRTSKIIHIHNLHGDFFSPVFFEFLLKRKKIIWTIHDESIYTGHCSCTLGCIRWKQGCGSCPSLNTYPSIEFDNTYAVLSYKNKIINKLNPILVCPSLWIYERVKKVYPNLQVEFIANGVDTNVFFPKSKNDVRKLLDLPLDKKIILFVAEFSTSNPFKGGEIIRKIVSEEIFSDVLFVTIGGNKNFKEKNHFSISHIIDEKILSDLYSACDFLLYPTQADNLPLVVLESMSCGTPVIASKIGGISEIIESGKDGILVENYTDYTSFLDTLSFCLNFETTVFENMKNSARLKIIDSFSFVQMSNKYELLYSSLNM